MAWNCTVCGRTNSDDHDRCNYFNPSVQPGDTERCTGRRPTAEAPDWTCPRCGNQNRASWGRCRHRTRVAAGRYVQCGQSRYADETRDPEAVWHYTAPPPTPEEAEAARRLAEEVMRVRRGDIVTIPSNQPFFAADSDARVLARVPEVDALITALKMTDEERHLIAWLVTHPHDKGAVMALADWLEENDRAREAARMREAASKREDA